MNFNAFLKTQMIGPECHFKFVCFEDGFKRRRTQEHLEKAENSEIPYISHSYSPTNQGHIDIGKHSHHLQD